MQINKMSPRNSKVNHKWIVDKIKGLTLHASYQIQMKNAIMLYGSTKNKFRHQLNA